MRMFVAARPSERALEDLESFLDVRRDAAPFRWTQTDQVHLTLAFLAQVPDRSLDELGDRLERAARKRTAFTTKIRGGGAFPQVARARVLWAGLELDESSAEELRRLATGARVAATRSGIAIDGQRFRPHLTLARMRAPIEATNWVRLLDTYAGPAWPIEEVELIASHLGEGPRKRPRHEVMATYRLGRND